MLHFISYYDYVEHGIFNYQSESDYLIKMIENCPDYQQLIKLLNNNKFNDLEIKTNTFPTIFNHLVAHLMDKKYRLKIINLKCADICSICKEPDYILKIDDNNSIWTTFKLEI